MSLMNRIVTFIPKHGYIRESFQQMVACNVAFPVKLTGKKETELSGSYASRLFSEIIVLDMGEMLNTKADEKMSRKEKDEFEALKKEAFCNIFARGISFEGKTWVALTSTPSEKKQGKAIFVPADEEKLLAEELGLEDDKLTGRSYVKTLDKLLPNCFSGQSEGSIAAAGLGMKNIFIMASRDNGTFYRHEVEGGKQQDLNYQGDLMGTIHEGKLANKIGDAQGFVIREALPVYRNAFISIASKVDPDAAAEMLQGNVVEAIKVAYFHNTLDKINAKIEKAARTTDEIDLYWMEQVRGKGLKATIIDAPIVEECIKHEINALDGFFGETKTIAQLIRENQIILITEDCLKAKELWTVKGAPKDASAWNAWIQKGYDKIWVCDNGHIAHNAKTASRVRTSRQHLCPIVGAQAEEKAQLASETAERLAEIVENGSEETQALAHLFGEDAAKSVLANYIDTDTMLPIRNFAEQGKVEANGAWGMVQWDPAAMIAVAAHLEDEAERPALIEKMRDLKGQTIAFTSKAKSKVGAAGRYPSLGMNLVFTKIEKQFKYCRNAIIMSWDVAANDILKMDTDGDHIVIYLPESDEEADEILNYIG